MSSGHVLRTSSRRLQRNNFSSSKTSSIGYARCPQDVLETEKLLGKTCLEDEQMFAGDSVINLQNANLRKHVRPMSVLSKKKNFFSLMFVSQSGLSPLVSGFSGERFCPSVV